MGITLKPATARGLVELLGEDSPGGAGRFPGGGHPRAVRCGQAVEGGTPAVPEGSKVYKGTLLDLRGPGGLASAGAELYLADLNGGEMKSGQAYLAARGGAWRGKPVYWSGGAGAGAAAVRVAGAAIGPETGQDPIPAGVKLFPGSLLAMSPDAAPPYGTDAVYVANFSGDNLTPGKGYISVRGGEFRGRSVYWCGEGAAPPPAPPVPGVGNDITVVTTVGCTDGQVGATLSRLSAFVTIDGRKFPVRFTS